MDAGVAGYFSHLGRLGASADATDATGDRLAIEDAVGRAVAMALETKTRNSRVFFVGNGGSAGIASHMATDWLKNGGFAATCFNDAASLTCISNDLGYEHVFALPIERHGRAGDLLVALSSSGRSPSILNAVAAARRSELNVVTMSGFRADNPLRRSGDLNFWVDDEHYGFVEVTHLALCHIILDMAMGWRRVGDVVVGAAPIPS